MTELERLRREWYRKDREANGSDCDIESIADPDGLLSNRGLPEAAVEHDGARGKAKRLRLEAGDYDVLAAYYRAAAAYTSERPWKTPMDRRIWELHADGYSERRIVATLRNEGLKPRGDAGGREMIRALIDLVRSELLGERRRVGRPRKPGGCGIDAKRLRVRLDDDSVAALQALMSKFGCGEGIAVRTALLFAARSL